MNHVSDVPIKTEPRVVIIKVPSYLKEDRADKRFSETTQTSKGLPSCVSENIEVACKATAVSSSPLLFQESSGDNAITFSESNAFSVASLYEDIKDGIIGQMVTTLVNKKIVLPYEQELPSVECMNTLEPLVIKEEPVEYNAFNLKEELSQHSETLTCKSEPAASPLAFCVEEQSLDQQCSEDADNHYDSLYDVCLTDDELKACIKTEKDAPVGESIKENSSQPAHCIDDKGPYTCDSCGSMYVSSITLSKHAPLCKGSKHNRTYYCQICARRFTKRGLAKHKVTQSGKHAYACDVCGKKFYLKGHLTKHHRVHKNPLFVCGKLFSNEEELFKYSQERTGNDPYSCDVCGRFFMYQFHLINHRRAHPGEYPLECNTFAGHSRTHVKVKKNSSKNFEGFCDLCGKRYKSRGSLLKHNRAHKGDFPYACDACSRKFASKVDLVRHTRIHTGERPFACETCGKGFTFKSSMVRHLRVHTGERPFKCEVCGKPFSCRSNLTKHAHLHTGKNLFSCGVCEKSYSCKTSLVKHLRIHST